MDANARCCAQVLVVYASGGDATNREGAISNVGRCDGVGGRDMGTVARCYTRYCARCYIRYCASCYTRYRARCYTRYCARCYIRYCARCYI